MPQPPAPIPVIASIAPLAPRYDAWLVDIWGVMHNGVQPFASAGEACRRFRELGGIVLLISNAPRPWTSVVEQLERIGVDKRAYDHIITSGDATRDGIRALGDRPILHLGPERDRPLFAGLNVRFVEPEQAQAVVCTGLYDDAKESPADYTALLERLQARRLTMLCANPDRKVERGQSIVYCAGAIAEAYERMGGKVIWNGKPYPPIYEMALRELHERAGRTVSRSRILAIGDGLDTDIAGAAAAGLDCVFVASGIHIAADRRFDAGLMAETFEGRPARPVAAMRELAW
jgi:HAD superfamily hydrolase (TIGR01459 family)